MCWKFYAKVTQCTNNRMKPQDSENKLIIQWGNHLRNEHQIENSSLDPWTKDDHEGVCAWSGTRNPAKKLSTQLPP